jgi:hypothetical protein
MEVIKRRICREDFISRSEKNYGDIHKPFIYINFQLIQDIDDIGVFTDVPFIEKIISGINKKDVLKGLRPSYNIKAWHQTGDILVGRTSSKLNDLKGYKEINRFKAGFDIQKSEYKNYNGKTVKGVSRVISVDDSTTKYTVDANNDGLIGTEYQNTGILYEDGISNTDSELNNIKGKYGDTKVSFQTQGLHEYNSSLSAIIKEAYLLGVISEPEIKNDVFIDRGINTVVENHLRMSEIETLEHLINYGNGYFNVSR